ncbi:MULTISPECIES: Imm30 family immunity protein [Photorhabdus]|uniref:Imm30 family immunity protein n=1 Tax=Photorhabdus TaxID=29487 RepID=UPI00232DC1CD|nr:Imm30 family immunity protein [Photorhabdus bodei]MDB6370176.1 Imm30 family immunity protein [Photorhabdus bodei]
MNLIESLEKSSSMDSPESIRIFPNALHKMAESKDKKYFPIILNYFDDESEYTDMMKEIMGMVGSFETIDYISTIIEFNEVLQKSFRLAWYNSL